MEPLEPFKPAPPRPEWIRPAAAQPADPAPEPMLAFFQKRLETLERELALERERSMAAQGLLSQQEALKSEVESNLKALSAQLRREKSEKESSEARSHAQGRIESLEKRLDEMNSTFARLLQEAVSRREAEGPSATALATELATFRGELRDLFALVPKVEGLSKRLPQEEKDFEESIVRRLDEFSARVARSLDDWKRSQEADRQRQEERLEAMTRERVDLARLWDDQSRLLREEQFKDRVARESEVSRQVATLASRLDAIADEQKTSAQGSFSVREAVARVISILTATPKAKDMLIEEASAESAELRRALAENQEALRRFAGERRIVEKSMGDSLVRLSAELEEERARTRAADTRAAEGLGEIEKLKARLPDLERSVSERDARLSALNKERDELLKSLVAEAEKVRRAIEERRGADAGTETQLALLRKRLEEESARRSLTEGAANDARARMVTMADQLARTLQERDATLARFSEWEKERKRLIETLQKKDEMISLLSETVRGALNKPT